MLRNSLRKILKNIYYFLLKKIFFLKPIYETRETAAPITITTWFIQKIIGCNRSAYWPVHFTSKVSGVQNILIGAGTAPGLSPGCYIQGIGRISIGDYTIVAPNVGIVSANHDIHDYRNHIKSEVLIGKYCWIGMNSVILPGVTLGDHTIVAAGSVVTKSFTEGYCIIGGSPAQVLKKIDLSQCIDYKNEFEYYGYIKKEKFDEYRKNNLKI